MVGWVGSPWGCAPAHMGGLAWEERLIGWSAESLACAGVVYERSSGCLLSSPSTISGCPCVPLLQADHMPDYALATLRRLAYSMRHSKSTAHVSDSAGERLTDDIMEHGGEGDDDEGTEGGSPGSSRNWSSRRQSPRAMAATVPPAPQPAMRRPGGGSASLLPV
jgi:hypothetical protein